MTMTIDISPEIEASLQEAAAKLRQTPEEYLQTMLETHLRSLGRSGRAWSEIEGAAAFPLVGEDAQAWVTRTRQEGDEHRERLLRPEIAQTTKVNEQ